MVSVVHAEDSSSASVNSAVCIEKIEWTSVGILKICLAEGPSFFVRDAYICDLTPDSFCVCRTLTEEEYASLVVAASTYLAERSAMGYLSRSEQCHFSLSIKLRKKGFSESEIECALRYLESIGSLDDRRFASAWLRNRSIHHSEGKQKLLAHLMSRGIAPSIAREAVSEYFEMTNEAELCMKAAEKLIRTGRDENSLVSPLLRRGFSSRIITECLKSIKTAKKA